MKIIEAVSNPGFMNKPNEDACGSVSDTAWVIDGATCQGESLVAGEGETDASWLAVRLNEALMRHAESFGADLPGLLERCQAGIRTKYLEIAGKEPLDRADVSSAAITLLHQKEDMLFCAALSDTVLFLVGKESKVDGWFGDPVHHQADADMLERLREFRQQGTIPLTEVRENLKPLIRGQRRSTNSPGSFGAFDPFSDFSKHLVRKSWGTNRFSLALLMSDGFSALSDKYGRYSRTGLVEAAGAKGLGALLAELRAIEEDDPECLKIPRYKKSDDATALLIEL